MLLPLVLPSSAAPQAAARRHRALVGAARLARPLALLRVLEYRGVAAFVAVWLASLAFFAANVGLVRLLVRARAVAAFREDASRASASSPRSSPPPSGEPLI